MNDRLRAGAIQAMGVGLAAALLLACASASLPPPQETDLLHRDTYVIGPSDQLGIRVWKNPDLSVDVPVRPDGKISVPLVDDVQAAGLTPTELKEVLTKELSEFITAPDVTVVVLQVNSKRVYVVGEVVRPMTIPLTQDLRVLDAIAIAGGFTPYSNKHRIKVIRRTGKGVREYRFDYEAFLSGKQPEGNLLLQPGDTIVVPD